MNLRKSWLVREFMNLWPNVLKYTASGRTLCHYLLALTLANADRFSKFFSVTLQKIAGKAVSK